MKRTLSDFLAGRMRHQLGRVAAWNTPGASRLTGNVHAVFALGSFHVNSSSLETIPDKAIPRPNLSAWGTQVRDYQGVRCVSSTPFHGAYEMGSQDESLRISPERFRELVEAESVSLGLKNAREFSINQIVQFQDLGELQEVLMHELPVRYAHRIKLLESVPNWNENEQLCEVHDKYQESFVDLRLLLETQQHSRSASKTVLSSSRHDPFLEEFRRTLTKIKERHRYTVKLMTGAGSLGLSEKETNEFLDRFFISRISTNLLISRYLYLASEKTAKSHTGNGVLAGTPTFDGAGDPLATANRAGAARSGNNVAASGMVNDWELNCDPAEICIAAMKNTKRLAKHRYGDRLKVQWDVARLVFLFQRYIYRMQRYAIAGSTRRDKTNSRPKDWIFRSCE